MGARQLRRHVHLGKQRLLAGSQYVGGGVSQVPAPANIRGARWACPIGPPIIVSLCLRACESMQGSDNTRRQAMVTGAWAVIGINTNMESRAWWGLAYLTFMIDASLFCLWL